jgi:hypothetical protein
MVAMLVLAISGATSVPGAAAPASQEATCSTAGMAGAWGHTLSGGLFPPSGAAAFANVGRTTFDTQGNVLGTQTSSVGGKISDETIKGSLSVNADCTGALAVGIYNQTGDLLRNAEWTTVTDNNQTELRAILKSLATADGTPIPAVVTFNSTRLSSDPSYTPTCSNASLNGEYAFTEKGVFLGQNGTTTYFASVGKVLYDGEGGFSATDTGSTNGKVAPNEVISGTYVMQPDCAGTMTANVGETSLQSKVVLLDQGKQVDEVWIAPGTVVTAHSVKLDGEPVF